MIPRLFALFLFACAGVCSFAQAPTASPKYVNEPFVIQSMSAKYVFQKDGTGTRELTASVLVQSDAGVQAFGVLEFPYEKDSEDVSVDYVRVRKPKGAIVATPASDVQDIDTAVSRIAPMYSDERVKHVLVKTLSVGDTLQYHVVTRVLKAAAPGHFWTSHSFFTDGIILDEQVEIDVPRDQYVNVKSATVQPVISDSGDIKIYRWKTDNLRHKTDEEKAKESKQEPPPPSIQLTTFRSWDEIAQWYAGLERDRLQPTDELRAKALELTKDAKTDTDKLRALYYYVSHDFRYIGLEFGVGRYQPHAASEVFANQYGDCKDKQTLLAAMAKAVGIDVNAVLVNSARKVDESVPSPAQFDHVIGVAQIGKDSYWLDTTAQVSPFGMLLYGIRDKRVLVVADKPEWQKTPANPPVATEMTFESTGELKQDGVFDGQLERTYEGDAAILVRAALRATGQPQWKDLVQNISYSTGFAGTVSDVAITGADDVEKPLDIKYSYHRKDFAEWVDRRRITAPLPPLSITTINDQGQDESSDPIIISGPFHERQRAVLTLPRGFTPEMLSNVSLHTDFGDYKSTYRLDGRQLTVVRELTMKPRELPRSRMDDFNKFAKAIIDDENSMFASKESGGSDTNVAAAALGGMLGVPAEDAAKLFEDGRQQMMARNFAAALETFHKVASADPKYPGVWSAIGMCYLVQGKQDEGISALHKEVENHPQDPQANLGLARVLYALHRQDEEAAVLRAFVKAAPTNPQAASALASMYSRTGNYKDAAAVLETALQTSSDDVVLVRQLGAAYAQAGDTEKALVTLKKAVTLKPDDDLTLNDAAYYLADANQDLTDAELWATKAVQAEEANTSSLALDRVVPQDFARMNSLASYWDTLGWVYFRKGNIAKAETYLKAAWDLSQIPAAAEHLGAVYEKEKKPLQAAKMYALAYRPVGIEWKPKPDNPLFKKAAALVGKEKAMEMLSSSPGDLSQMRTIHLPRIVKGDVHAEFLLLLDSGGLENIRFVSGDLSIGDATAVLKKELAGKFRGMAPAGSNVKLVRRAMVVCPQIPDNTCFLALMLPEAVPSTN